MKELRLLIWLTQLGLSTALPLAGFVLLGIRLHKALGWGRWSVWAGLVLGAVCAFSGFRDALRAMERMATEESGPPDCPTDHD